jgi:hypothetical protein
VLGARGGRRRAAACNVSDLPEFQAPATAGDLLGLLAEALAVLRGGRLDPKTANALAFLGATLLRTYETVTFEARLKALENQREGNGNGV